MDNKTTSAANYGIHVKLPVGDPFEVLLDEDWSAEHWYTTERERDRALQDMAQEHIYSRRGDRPTLIFSPIERNTTRN
jgi:hypothetical protein